MKRWHWLVIVPLMLLGLVVVSAVAQEGAPAQAPAAADAEVAAPATAAAAETEAAPEAADASEPAMEPFVSRLWRAQGLMHPVVVHFPIAMIIGAALAVVLRLFIRGISPGVVYYCLLIGAMGAIVSTLAGWAWAPARGYGDVWDMDSEMFWHRWGGIIVTVLAVIISLWATQRVRKPESRQFGWQFAVVILAAMIGLVGHQGGELVYPDNLEKFWTTLTGTRKRTPPPQLPVITKSTANANAANGQTKTGGNGVTPAVNPPGETVDFATQVWPILQAKCIDCHGAEKNKGKFRMHTQEAALAGGSSDEPGYIPGKPMESLIIRLITAEDELDRMPPVDEGEPVTPEELALLVKWIEQGAQWNTITPAAAASSGG